MEKLRQFQKYQFWVLLGVALILPLVGWFMSSSALKAEADERAKKLKSLEEALAVRPDDPNETWGQKVAAINVDQEQQVMIAWRALYARQQPFMVWPKDLPDDPAKIENIHQDIYR